MKIIVGIFSSMLSVLVLNYFFGKVLTQKNFSKAFEYFINFYFVLVFSVIAIALSNNEFTPLLFQLTTITFGSIKYRDKITKKVLWIFVISAMIALSEVVAAVTLSSVLKSNIESIQENAMFYLIGSILSKLILYTVLRAVGFFKLKSDIQLDFKSILAVITIPVSTLVSIYYIAYLSFDLVHEMLSFGIVSIIVLIVLSNISTFYLLERQAKLYKTEQDLLNIEKQYKLQAEYYLELKENMLISNQQAHNVKSFVAAIHNYLDKQQIDLAKNRIDEYLKSIPIISSVDTGNDAINALLYYKMGNIEKIKNNSLSILLPPKLYIDEIDLCIIIGNAIDNCLEASLQIEDEDKRFISVKIFPYNNQISMLFKNSHIRNSEKKLLQTTKQQKMLHGFGTKSMKALCEKYNGSIIFEQSNDNFMVSILLQNSPF